MSNFMLQGHALMDSIDVLTKDIASKIRNNDFEDVSVLLSQRIELIAQLIALSRTDTDRDILLKFLLDLQRHENSMIEIVSKEHRILEKTLLNLNNLKQYVLNSD